MIDEEFSTELLRKHSFLSHRESIDWLTVECPPEEVVSISSIFTRYRGL